MPFYSAHGNPATRDVPDGDLHAWYVVDGTAPGSYLVMPPAIGGGSTGYRVSGYYDACALAHLFNSADPYAIDPDVADQFDAEVVPV